MKVAVIGSGGREHSLCLALKKSSNVNEILEKMIVKNPDQWIWSHNRWK